MASRKTARQFLFIALGSLFFALGALGLFLPVLPTTPFWLLTAYFYLNASTRLYNKVMGIPVFGSTVTNYKKYRAIPLRAKAISVSLIWSTTILSSLLVAQLWVALLLVVISLGVTIHILSYKTLRDDMKE